MMWWIGLAGFFGAAVIAGLLSPRSPAGKTPAPSEPSPNEELWTPEALARLGTPETVADLAAQGRADELRGLGYRGDLPGE